MPKKKKTERVFVRKYEQKILIETVPKISRLKFIVPKYRVIPKRNGLYWGNFHTLNL